MRDGMTTGVDPDMLRILALVLLMVAGLIAVTS